MANLKLRSTTTATDPGSTSAKGSALTHAEMDSNFILLQTDINSKIASASPTLTGTVQIDNNGILQFNEATANGSNYVQIKTPAAIASNYVLTLPPDDGTSGQVLTTDGSGVLTFTDKTALTSLDIDGFTDGTSITVAATDKLLIQDGTTEKKINASQMLDYVETGITMTGDLTSTAGATALGATTMSGDLNTQANALTGTTVTPSTGQYGGFDSSVSKAIRIQGPTAGKDHAIVMQQTDSTGGQAGRQNIAFITDTDGSYSASVTNGSGLIYSPLNMQVRDDGHATKTRTTFDIGVPYRGGTGSTITQGSVTGKLLDVVTGSRKIYLQNVSGGSFATSTATTGVVTGTVTAVNSIGTNAVELTYDTDFASTAATSDLADIGFARFSARDVLNTNGMRTSEPELHLEAGRIALESNGTKQIDIEDAGGMTLTTRSNGNILLTPNGTGQLRIDTDLTEQHSTKGIIVHDGGQGTYLDLTGAGGANIGALYGAGVQVEETNGGAQLSLFSHKTNGATAYPNLWAHRSRDDGAGNKDFLNSDDIIFQFFGAGWDGTTSSSEGKGTFRKTAAVELKAAENHSASAGGGKIEFYTNENGSISFAGVKRMTIDEDIEMHKNVVLHNQSGDPSTVANASHIYAKDESSSSEVFVRDEAGNVTKISPHNAQGEWEYYSRNINTGKVVRVNMEQMIRDIEQLTGNTYIENE
jgi:hypothetical protein